MHRWLRYCVKIAKSTTTSQRYRLHAVLVRGGAVLAQGSNLAVSDILGKVFNPDAPEWIGLHAEMACIRRARPDQLVGATLYVGGVTASGNIVTSKPCHWCYDVLSRTGISRIVWHDTAGNTHSIKLRRASVISKRTANG